MVFIKMRGDRLWHIEDVDNDFMARCGEAIRYGGDTGVYATMIVSQSAYPKPLCKSCADAVRWAFWDPTDEELEGGGGADV